MHVDDQLLWHDVLAAVLLKYGGKTLPHAASPGPVEALALQLVKSSYGPDGYRLFLKPSDSWNGWLGVSSTHAAQAAGTGPRPRPAITPPAPGQNTRAP